MPGYRSSEVKNVVKEDFSSNWSSIDSLWQNGVSLLLSSKDTREMLRQELNAPYESDFRNYKKYFINLNLKDAVELYRKLYDEYRGMNLKNI
jgi:hypothetical protein